MSTISSLKSTDSSTRLSVRLWEPWFLESLRPWEVLDLPSGAWAFAFDVALDNGEIRCVLVAGKGRPKGRTDLRVPFMGGGVSYQIDIRRGLQSRWCDDIPHAVQVLAYAVGLDWQKLVRPWPSCWQRRRRSPPSWHLGEMVPLSTWLLTTLNQWHARMGRSGSTNSRNEKERNFASRWQTSGAPKFYSWWQQFKRTLAAR